MSRPILSVIVGGVAGCVYDARRAADVVTKAITKNNLLTVVNNILTPENRLKGFSARGVDDRGLMENHDFSVYKDQMESLSEKIYRFHYKEDLAVLKAIAESVN